MRCVRVCVRAGTSRKVERLVLPPSGSVPGLVSRGGVCSPPSSHCPSILAHSAGDGAVAVAAGRRHILLLRLLGVLEAGAEVCVRDLLCYQWGTWPLPVPRLPFELISAPAMALVAGKFMVERGEEL